MLYLERMQNLTFATNPWQSESSPSKICTIAVVGITGSGKSSFIKRVTGNQGIGIGNGLASRTQCLSRSLFLGSCADKGIETEDVKAYSFTSNNVKYTLVDTPGFDDTDREDYDIFQAVVQWMESSYRSGTRLNGILYLHRITDRRMQGTALQNLTMFRKICGEDCFKNVLLGTTCWDLVDPDIGAAREQELADNPEFWGDMVSRGSKILRVHPDRASNMEILRQMMGKASITLKVQEELVHQGRKIQQTGAVRTTKQFSQLEATRKKYQEAEKARKSSMERQLREAEMAAERRRLKREEAMRKEKAAQDKQRKNTIRQMEKMQRAAKERRQKELEKGRQRQEEIRAAQLRQDQKREKLRREQRSLPKLSSKPTYCALYMRFWGLEIEVVV